MIHWHWHLRHAEGYRELGLRDEARKELALVPSAHHGTADYVAAQAALAQDEHRWADLSQWGQRWVAVAPTEAGAWILWAYGTRRAVSLEAAEQILLEGLRRHPHHATLHFNLGCYACQRGDLPLALRRVLRAIALDPAFKALAAEDPDLLPLRQTGQL